MIRSIAPTILRQWFIKTAYQTCKILSIRSATLPKCHMIGQSTKWQALVGLVWDVWFMYLTGLTALDSNWTNFIPVFLLYQANNDFFFFILKLYFINK